MARQDGDFTDEEIVAEVFGFLQANRRHLNAPFIANNIRVPVEKVLFILKELHYDGVIYRNGSWFSSVHRSD